jgi:Tol biopolymer transport system component
VSDWGIWAVQADGSEEKHIAYHLTPADTINGGGNPDWGMTGQIVFRDWQLNPLRQILLVMDDMGRNAKIIFDPKPFGYNNGLDHPQFSPDGTKIVFQTQQTTTQDPQIWVINADGSQPQQLTTAGGRHPSWSPDGQHIVYARYSLRYPNQPGNNKLWIMDADSGNKRQLTF